MGRVAWRGVVAELARMTEQHLVAADARHGNPEAVERELRHAAVYATAAEQLAYHYGNRYRTPAFRRRHPPTGAH